MSNALFIDLAFANIGWIVFDVEDDYSYINCGCIKTSKSAKVRKIRVASDDIRRCKEITDGILDIIDLYDIEAVAVEDPSGGARSARSARCLGMSTGVIAAVESITKLPFLHVTPSEVKLALCDKKTASKKSMMDEARKVVPEFEDMPKSQFEHIADAVGVAQAVKDDPIIRMLRRV